MMDARTMVIKRLDGVTPDEIGAPGHLLMRAFAELQTDYDSVVRERDELLAFGRQWEKEMMSEFDPAELENDPLWQKWRSAVEGK